MSTSSAKAQAVDPVTVEIIRNGLLAVTEEMKTNLTRTRISNADQDDRYRLCRGSGCKSSHQQSLAHSHRRDEL